MSEPRSGRFLVPLCAGSIVIALVVLVSVVSVAQVEVADQYWDIDPQTGLVNEKPNSPYPVMAMMYERHIEIVRPICLVVFAFVSIIVATMWRRSRQLELAVLPVVVPLVLTLGIGLLARRWTQATLVDIFEWFSEIELEYRPGDFDDLLPCSRLLVFDTVFSLACVMLLAITTALLVPALRVTWRAKGSTRLGGGWSSLAVVCFILGASALLYTRAHRSDRSLALDACAAREEPRNRHWLVSPVEFHASEVEVCVSVPEWAHINEAHLGVGYRVHPDGKVADFWPGVWEDDPDDVVDMSQARPVIPLYVDTTTPIRVLAEVLATAHDAGVEAVLLLGTSTISGELATVGPWRRRVHCAIGVLELGGTEQDLHEFESVAELAGMVSRDGVLGVALDPRSPIPTH